MSPHSLLLGARAGAAARALCCRARLSPSTMALPLRRRVASIQGLQLRHEELSEMHHSQLMAPHSIVELNLLS
ncbi:MAG: hypothetical protein SGPRY_013869 [Prymnesium sp.]